MPQCRLCGYDGPGGTPRCPGCGAHWHEPADRSPGGDLADGSPTGDDLEFRLLQLLREGQKIAAVKLYRQEMGTGLKESKDAVEALAARHGMAVQRPGCGGTVLLAALLLGGLIVALAVLVPPNFWNLLRGRGAAPPAGREAQDDGEARDDGEAGAKENLTMRLAKDVVARERVLVIAHRGDSKAAPENTLSAFASAAKHRPDLIELDYHHSADGVPIVLHDKDLDRTTDAAGQLGRAKVLVADLPAARLQTLDAGKWFDARFAGARLPTLAESLDTIQPHAVTLIERKAGDAQTLIKLLTDRRELDRVVVQAFDWPFLADCRQLAPDLVLVALGEKPLTVERLAELDKFHPAGIGWSDKDITPEAITLAHARQLKVWVYTVDDTTRAKELIAWGADGIITNVPGEMGEGGGVGGQGSGEIGNRKSEIGNRKE